MRIRRSAFLAGLLGVLLVPVAGCGGGGGGGDVDFLAGTWGGPGFESNFLQITFDDEGDVAAAVEAQTLPGPHFAEPLPDDVYRLTLGLDGGVSVVLYMIPSPSGDYAALVGSNDLFALERGATAPRAAPATLADFGPATWAGRSAVLTAVGDLLEDTSGEIDFAADGSYDGSTAAGLTFSSVGATPTTILDVAAGSIESTYQDDDAATDAVQLLAIQSPDGQFLAGIACLDPVSDALADCRFVAGWEKE